MSSLDFGTWISAVVMFVMTVTTAIAAAFRWIFQSAWTRLWASIKALFSSPAAWCAALSMLAIGLFSGFCVGYIDGVSGKRALRSEIAELRSASEGHEKAKTAAEAKVASLQTELAALKEKASPDAKSEAVAGDFKRPVVRAVKPKPTAGEANKGQWWPWEK